MERWLDEALAQLVIKNRFAGRKLKYGSRTGALVLQLESADDAVRSWPAEFHRRYSGALPVNEPVGIPGEVARREGADELAAFADELMDIAQGCGFDGRPPYRLPITFPRFAAAYAVLVSWQPIGERTTRAEHDALLERWVKRAIVEARSHTLQELRRRLGRLPQDGFITGKLGGLVGFALRLIGRLRFPHLRTLLWYRKKGLDIRAPHTTRMLIKELRRRRELPVEQRGLLLVEAMLADINAHYGFFRRLNRARLPVILLPDVDRVPARRRIRDALLRAYDGKARNLRAYPVVISTSAAGAAPPVRGANPPVPASELMERIPELFAKREQAAEERRVGDEVPLPSRLLQVSLGPPDNAPVKEPRFRSPGPVTAFAALMMTVILGTGALALRGPESCGENLERLERDCVGVSDGTGVFMPGFEGMREVSARIEAENERIASRKHATVALMIPMESDIPAVRAQIRSELQGAYLAQAAANGSGAVVPPIRLVLANPGRDYAHWRHTVDRLVDREPRLRVVAGFNLSLDNTWRAMTHLTRERGIPVVAGLVTSGDFANPENRDRDKDPFPGLARVVSPAKEQAAALLSSDPGLAGAETALVADTRPKDNYNNSLWAAFTEARKGKQGSGVQDMTFESPGLEEPGITPNKFEDFALNLCQSNARHVYFAGRAFHLELFIKKLAGTYCATKKSYTVISGSDATSLDSRLDQDERRLLRGDPGAGRPSVSVTYAAPAHPDAWDAEVRKWQARHTRGEAEPRPEDLPRHLAEPRDALTALRQAITAANLGEVALADGRTIITHDVVLTAARELARAAAVTRTEIPPRERVREAAATLNAAYRVRGASGWICLTNAGNPYNKALSVVRLDPASPTLRFEGVAWPTGRPPDDNCVVPQTTS